MPTPILRILHWNDVYKIGPQKVSSTETIDVTKFTTLVEDIRAQWVTLPNGQKNGLTLFSGDLFSPSLESTITRGNHMVPVMNALAPDAALTGNHDFDFGYPHLTKLVQACNFPWVLSNIIDSNTSRVPEYLHEFKVFERAGLRIGVIGLVERDWITTVSSWPVNFVFKDMYEAGEDLSRRLRDPQGEYRCDVIVALTHSRLPNDITLAKKLLALSPMAQMNRPITNEHGVDLVLGGHDHLYYASKGFDGWEGYDPQEAVLGAENDAGDTLIVKSGYDFRDLSELTILLEATPTGCVRRHVIKRITGKRCSTSPQHRSSETMKELIDTLLKSVSSTLKAPVCRTLVSIDLRARHIRTRESAGGNWFTDILHHAYDDALCISGCGGADGVLISAGTLRGDSVYDPGTITLGNILEILPFQDSIIVLEVDGATLWDALESSLSSWPAQEGRFPVISGFRVSWDSRRPPGNRVLGVWLVSDEEESNEDSGLGDEAYTYHFVDVGPIAREKGGRKYRIVTREYMAEGHDGYVALKDQKQLIDGESGTLMSTLVRRYLLGSQFVKKMLKSTDSAGDSGLQVSTHREIMRASIRKQSIDALVLKATRRWKDLVRHRRSRTHFRNQFNVSVTENMTIVDAFDGKSGWEGKITGGKEQSYIDDLIIVAPVIDGRLLDGAHREGAIQA
ncbi:hypothetical protein AX15_002916 [Amanita polypyramis BW_CC]|nr:hypothetical protein AX15_002916 [Amanita polypyramis BW_CC]